MSSSPDIEEITEELTLALLFEPDSLTYDNVEKMLEAVKTKINTVGAKRLRQTQDRHKIVRTVETWTGTEWRVIMRGEYDGLTGTVKEMFYDDRY